MESAHDELVDRAGRGERDALDALFQRHLPGLLAYVRLHAGQHLRERESSLDLVQSVCREVLADLHAGVELDEPHFRAWLYTAAERKLVDRARHHGRAKRDAAREVAFDPEPSASNDDLVAAGVGALFTPSREAQAREEFARFERAFRALPDEYREVIALARIVGLPHAEIAARLGKSEGAARVLLHRALARLASSADVDAESS